MIARARESFSSKIEIPASSHVSLPEVFAILPDSHSRHELRYDLPFLLTCLVAALLCNCDGTEAVAQWCHDHLALLRRVFGRRLFLTPSGSLYRWLLPQLDACAIECVLGSWIQTTTTAPADEPLTLDGKTVRGARSGKQTAPHLLAFCTHHSQETCLPSAGGRENQRNPRCQARPADVTHPAAGLYR